jgi:hypothetical protein
LSIAVFCNSSLGVHPELGVEALCEIAAYQAAAADDRRAECAAIENQ